MENSGRGSKTRGEEKKIKKIRRSKGDFVGFQTNPFLIF